MNSGHLQGAQDGGVLTIQNAVNPAYSGTIALSPKAGNHRSTLSPPLKPLNDPAGSTRRPAPCREGKIPWHRCPRGRNGGGSLVPAGEVHTMKRSAAPSAAVSPPRHVVTGIPPLDGARRFPHKGKYAFVRNSNQTGIRKGRFPRPHRAIGSAACSTTGRHITASSPSTCAPA